MPGTVMWIAQRMAEEKPEQRKGILGLWVHPRWEKEVSDQTVEELNCLSDEDVIEALNELWEPKRYIQKQGGMQMNIPIKLQILEDRQFLSIKALLDSGCTRLCMG